MLEELEQVVEEAMAWAGICSQEWTNMNPSDPGVTILENLSALHLVQKEAAGQVTDEARLAILRLAGFTRQEAENARLLVAPAEPQEPASFPKHQKFYVNDVCFETEEALQELQGRLLGVYVKEQDKYRELRELKEGVPLNARPFGSRPEAGDAVYFLFQNLPVSGDTKLRLYIQVKKSVRRNPFSEEEPVEFARMQWSCLGSSGFEDILFQDDTHGFLQSGEISLCLDTIQPVKTRAGAKEGYMLCCRIAEADYDRAPEIAAVYGLLFPLIQRDTWSFSAQFDGGGDIRLYPVFPEEMFLTVYVREPGSAHYVIYGEAPGREEGICCAKDRADGPGNAAHGRYFVRTKGQDGEIHIRFQEEVFGYGPAKEPGAVTVVCCNRHMMLHRELGILEGYDDQYVDCPPGGEADEKVVCLGVRRRDGASGEAYRFFSPGIQREDSIYYTYDEDRRQICIRDAGPYRGCEAFLSDYAVSVWEAGNIRFGNMLVSVGGNDNICVKNPVKGTEGRRKESLHDVRKRFLKDMKTPVAAVTEEDYELLAMQVPGLCIRKARAYYEEQKERICVVVMPRTEVSFPVLSSLYRRHIYNYLDKRRLITDKVTVKEPAYTPVSVYVTVSVRDRESWDVKRVRQEIAEELDDRRNRRKIGQNISFDRLSSRIRSCPGAGHILELKVVPAGVPGRLIRSGADIPIPPDAACYPGEIIIREE